MMTDQLKLALLDDVLSSASSHTERADKKATTLFGVVSALLAAVIVLAQRPLPAAAVAALWVAAVPLAFAELTLLRALRPRIGRQVPAGTWLHAALTGPESLLDAVAESVSDESALIRRRAHDAAMESHIALRKYVDVRAATTALMLAFAVCGVALVLIAAL